MPKLPAVLLYKLRFIQKGNCAMRCTSLVSLQRTVDCHFFNSARRKRPKNNSVICMFVVSIYQINEALRSTVLKSCIQSPSIANVIQKATKCGVKKIKD
jgi:hypothetical protein